MKVTRYEIREFNGNSYSKRLGRRLRTRVEAGRIVKLLKKQGREVYKAAINITL